MKKLKKSVNIIEKRKELNQEKTPKYGTRKLSVGLVSCMLGFSLIIAPSYSKAAEEAENTKILGTEVSETKTAESEKETQAVEKPSEKTVDQVESTKENATNQTVEKTEAVVKKQADNFNAELQTLTVDQGKNVEDYRNAVKNLPQDAKLEVKTQVDTKEAGLKTIKAIIIFSDNSTKEVDITVKVNQVKETEKNSGENSLEVSPEKAQANQKSSQNQNKEDKSVSAEILMEIDRINKNGKETLVKPNERLNNEIVTGVYGGSPKDEVLEAVKKLRFKVYELISDDKEKEIDADVVLGDDKRWSGAYYINNLDRSKRYKVVLDHTTLPDGYNYWFEKISSTHYPSNKISPGGNYNNYFILDGSKMGEFNYGHIRLHLGVFDVIFPKDEETAKKIFKTKDWVSKNNGKTYTDVLGWNDELVEGRDYVRKRITKDHKIDIAQDFKTKEGYKFLYWYASLFDKNGNQNEYDISKYILYKGSPFRGWDTDSGLNNTDVRIKYRSYIVLPKLYRPKVTFNYNYKNDEGKVEENIQDVFYEHSFKDNKTSSEELPNIKIPERENYIFKGWNTKEDGSGEVFDENTIVKSDQKVFAQWEEKEDYIIVEWKHRKDEKVTHHKNYDESEEGKAPGEHKGKKVYLTTVVRYEGINQDGEKKEFFVYGYIPSKVGEAAVIKVPKKYTDKQTGETYTNLKFVNFYLPNWGGNTKWGYGLHGEMFDESLVPSNTKSFTRVEIDQQANTHIEYKIKENSTILDEDKDNIKIKYNMHMSKKEDGGFSDEELSKLRNGNDIEATDKFENENKKWLSALNENSNFGDAVSDNHLPLFSAYTGKYKKYRLSAEFTGENSQRLNELYTLTVEGNDLEGWTVTLGSKIKSKKQERKEDIEYKTIRKENPNLQKGLERVVQKGIKGNKTYYDDVLYVTLADGSEKIIKLTKDNEGKITQNPQDQIIEYGSLENKPKEKQAEIIDPNIPDKTGVKDLDKLTEKEKSEVVDKIKEVNKDKFPEGTDVSVDDRGNATITYPDKSKDTIPAKDLVFQYKHGDPAVEEKPEIKISDIIDPSVPDKTGVKDPNKLTEKEKSEIADKIKEANKDKFPEGTDVSVDDKGNATITYPDKSKDTIPAENLVFEYKKGDSLVQEKPEMKISDIIDPTVPGKTEVGDKDKLTEKEKSEIADKIKEANKDKFPEGTDVSVDDKGNATITYPDGSKDTIDRSKLVVQKAKETERKSKKVKVDKKANGNSNNVQTGVGSLVGTLATLTVAVSGLFASKKKERK